MTAGRPGKADRSLPEAAAAPAVLLIGPEAELLNARLAVSGYRPLLAADLQLEPALAPRALILAPGAEDQIPALRLRFPGIALLLGINSDSLEGRIRCLSSGADDFWITAIGPSDLLTRLRLHLGLGQRHGIASPVPAPRLLLMADLSVNTATREVKRGRRMISLTAREYDLLLLLLRRSGAVVSRERILKAIWRDERPAASNVIEVYVRYLRQKLEQAGERRLIHTVRGHGYCLAERLPPRPSDPA